MDRWERPSAAAICLVDSPARLRAWARYARRVLVLPWRRAARRLPRAFSVSGQLRRDDCRRTKSHACLPNAGYLDIGAAR